MNICSAVCLSGVHTCCNQDNSSQKPCCQNKNPEQKEDKSCEDIHLKYFSSIGQFSEYKEIGNNTYFPTILSILPLINNDDLFTLRYHYFHFGYSHSPPIKPDIRTAIQSFQI